MPNIQPVGPDLCNCIPRDGEAQLYPQALGVHLIAFYDLHELAVGLFFFPVTTRELSSIKLFYCSIKCILDYLPGIVISMSDCHPRGPGFDSRLYPRNFSGTVGSGKGSTQPREENWVST